MRVYLRKRQNRNYGTQRGGVGGSFPVTEKWGPLAEGNRVREPQVLGECLGMFGAWFGAGYGEDGRSGPDWEL